MSGRLAIERMIEDPMSEMILKGEIPNGAKVIIEANDKAAEGMTRKFVA